MPPENKALYAYTPDTVRNAPIKYIESLHPVVDNIARVLPPEEIWNLFSSTLTETGGKINFPYSRVDVSLILARDCIQGISRFGWDWKYAQEFYARGSRHAFEALVWVEIGFGGLEQLAYSDASRNWTSGVGHFNTKEDRAQKILHDGRDLYDECITVFAEFRQKYEKQDDLFTKYHLEHLLDPFIQK
jgi:hypothetical protein